MGMKHLMNMHELADQFTLIAKYKIESLSLYSVESEGTMLHNLDCLQLERGDLAPTYIFTQLELRALGRSFDEITRNEGTSPVYGRYVPRGTDDLERFLVYIEYNEKESSYDMVFDEGGQYEPLRIAGMSYRDIVSMGAEIERYCNHCQDKLMYLMSQTD